MMTLVLFPSSTPRPDAALDAEHQIARLTAAAYQVALQNGITGSFIDVELRIWSAIRGVIEAEPVSQDHDVQDRREPRRMPARIAGKG